MRSLAIGCALLALLDHWRRGAQSSAPRCSYHLDSLATSQSFCQHPSTIRDPGFARMCVRMCERLSLHRDFLESLPPDVLSIKSDADEML